MFVVAAPRSGAAALLAALARAPGVLTAGAGADPVIDGVFELGPANRGWEDNRLTAADAHPRAVNEIRERLKGALADRDGNRPGLDAAGLRWADASPRNALRVPFLDAIAPDAIFVFVHREPAGALADMLETWRSGSAVSYPELPGWDGPPWSLPLAPGWRELAGMEPAELVTEQWLRIVSVLLDDLEALPPRRWCVTGWEALLSRPEQELERTCGFAGIEPSEELTLPLRALADRVATSGEPAAGAELTAELLERTAPLDARARELLARPTRGRPAPRSDSPLRSVYTQSFPQMLERLGGSLLVSTYQTGKLICARPDRGTVNTHFRDFERPMGLGLAVAPGRIAIGTRAEVLDYRDFPAVAPKVEPVGRHDACFLPRNKHFTGDIRIHEVAFASGEPWIAATNFSCLATLDAQHSFVPRWAPPFITELANEDRCHLNGICVVEDRVRYVTALGATDEPGGWRENKASGGS